MAAKSDFLTFLFGQAHNAHMAGFWSNSIDVSRSDRLAEKFHSIKISKTWWTDDVKWVNDKDDILVSNPLGLSFEAGDSQSKYAVQLNENEKSEIDDKASLRSNSSSMNSIEESEIARAVSGQMKELRSLGIRTIDPLLCPFPGVGKDSSPMLDFYSSRHSFSPMNDDEIILDREFWSGSPGSCESYTGKTADFVGTDQFTEIFSTPCLELSSENKKRPISTVVSEEDVVTDEDIDNLSMWEATLAPGNLTPITEKDENGSSAKSSVSDGSAKIVPRSFGETHSSDWCEASSTPGARSTSEDFGQVERGVEELLQCIAGKTTISSVACSALDDGLLSSTSNSNCDESLMSTTTADFGPSQETSSAVPNETLASFDGSATIQSHTQRRLSFTDIASPSRPSLPLKFEHYAQTPTSPSPAAKKAHVAVRETRSSLLRKAASSGDLRGPPSPARPATPPAMLLRRQLSESRACLSASPHRVCEETGAPRNLYYTLGQGAPVVKPFASPARPNLRASPRKSAMPTADGLRMAGGDRRSDHSSEQTTSAPTKRSMLSSPNGTKDSQLINSSK